jgi:serine/threonine protein kinase
MPGQRIGKFQIVGTLGKGAHSTILHIRRSADSRNYALKVVPINDSKERKYLEQARHEFRVAQLLDHPSLVKIYSLEIQRDWLFHIRRVHLLIEYVSGRTLDTLKALPVAKLVQIFARIAAGLAHMHRRKVYHADLKPNNIMLSRAGDVKIIDYGLAWIRGESKGRIQGTPEYMAPEQLRDGIVNEQTDIFNFGATMYRLTTWRPLPNPGIVPGQVPLDARSWKQRVPSVSECNAEAPPELAELIHRCIEFKPVQRPEDIGEVRDTLEDLVGKLVHSPGDSLETIE